jgi:bifunctional non-homologous end joining protein LigD
MVAASPRPDANSRPPRFVVQKHWARALHYDFRLELGDRLVSWAVPKGPSRDPKVRRLAIRMPDHPVDYATFEGSVPPGEYGAGTVMVWDTGTYRALRPAGVTPADWLDRGFLKFILYGAKLRGQWEMVRYQTGPSSKENWLWVKLRDRHVQPGYVPESEPKSVLSGKTVEEIRATDGTPEVSHRERPLEAWSRPCADEPFELGEDPGDSLLQMD